MDNQSCRTGAHARVCEENKLEELEEKTTPIKIIFLL